MRLVVDPGGWQGVAAATQKENAFPPQLPPPLAVPTAGSSSAFSQLQQLSVQPLPVPGRFPAKCAQTVYNTGNTNYRSKPSVGLPT